MKARARAPHRTIQAFTGREFVGYEWRPVPDGAEDEAMRLEAGGFLELQSDDPPAAPPPVVEVNATPSAAALAELSGIDLASLVGSGFDGRILKSDVEAALGEEE